MPQITALTINDGAATPVAHTFGPVTSNGSKAEWADRSSATSAGYRVITNEVRKPASATAAYRNITTFTFPVEATVNGVVTVVGYSSAKVEFNFRQEATDQERDDAHAYVQNYLGVASVADAIKTNSPHY